MNLTVDYNKNFTADTGKVVLKFYNGSSHISANDSNSSGRGLVLFKHTKQVYLYQIMQIKLELSIIS